MPGHGHSHGGGSCEHDHDPVDNLATSYNLYQKVDIANVQCLNEVTDGSGKKVFKAWSDRADRTHVSFTTVL